MSALVMPCVLEAALESCLDRKPLGEHSRYAAEYLRKKIFSKYSEGVISKKAENRALEKFAAGCVSVENFEIRPGDLFDETLLSRFRDRCKQFFVGIDPESFSLPSLHQRGGVGPGASIAAHGTDFLRKFYYGPVSCTSRDVMHAYLRGCASNPLDLIAAKNAAEVFGWWVEDCSRISFVEKNVDEARTIATEPSVNMFFQLAIGDVINERLGHIYKWSKSSTPNLNRIMAYAGSKSGFFTTIDLQSASDSIGLALCRYALPSYLYELLLLYRCSSTKLPGGQQIRLPMVSTMGNGWTFSLMTALLYCALHAVCDVVGDSSDIRSCSVFGDDIVIPYYLTRGTNRILKLLGFVVNQGKSYSEGAFRESCGHDFYDGKFVRPVYIRKLDTQNSLYVAFNRLAEWGAFHDVDLYPVLKLLADRVPRVLVPMHADFASGFRVPSLLSQSMMIKGGLWRYKRFEAVPITYDVAEVPVRVRTLSPSVNPEGVFVSFIGGYLRNGKISERSERKVHWRLAKRITPNWDTRDSPPCPGWDKAAERRWKASVGSFFMD
jgi:hypothetical protein